MFAVTVLARARRVLLASRTYVFAEGHLESCELSVPVLYMFSTYRQRGLTAAAAVEELESEPGRCRHVISPERPSRTPAIIHRCE